MANPDGTPREVHVQFNNGTGTITYREDSSSYLMDWNFEWNENLPREVLLAIDNMDTTAAVNLLNASCAQWSSGTAALELGDAVTLGLYQSDGSTVDTLFEGVIVDISQAGNGVVVVKAIDYLSRLDHLRPSITHGDFVDGVRHGYATGANFRILSNVTNTDLVEPLARIEFAHTDVRASAGNGVAGTTHTLDADGEWVALAFIAKGNLMGVNFKCTTGGAWDGDILVNICMDAGDEPGTQIASKTMLSITTGTKNTDFTSGTNAVTLVVGRKYWVQFEVSSRTAGDIYIHAEGWGGAYPFSAYVYDVGAGAVAEANDLLEIDLDFLVYDDMDTETAVFSDTYDLVGFWDENDISEVGSHSPLRGRLSYYHGTFTLEALCQRLIKLDTGMLHDVSTNLDRTLKVYSTQGKPLGDCMREIMDLYEDTGSWDGYQHVMAHYIDGSDINRLKVCKRKKTSDSATYILSYAADTANDDEHIIIAGGAKLRKTNKMKYATVIVTGKSGDGRPLVCQRHDKALSTSFHDQMSGIVETLKVSDNNLRSLEDVDRECWRLLDAVNCDVWEGEIVLSGQHEDMMDWDNSSDTYGSGNIVTINYSPLGISNTKFKVTAMKLRPFETSIYINNRNPWLENKLTRSFGRMEMSEAFASPIGYVETIFLEVFEDTVITDATLYMELHDNSDVAFAWDRIPCTKFSNSDYNVNVYHCEIPPGFRAGDQGVRYIELYTAATGGTKRADIDLNKTVSSIPIDVRPDKFMETTLIIEVSCPSS